MIRIGNKSRRDGTESVLFRGRTRLVQLLVAFAALAPVRGAAGVTVAAQLERPQIQLGDSVGLQIVVADSTGANIAAQVPQVDGLDIRHSGSTMQLSGGRRSDILNYVVIPSREGNFVIPPITVRVSGQPFTTNQLVLTVAKTSESAGMRLTASASNRECYVLEPVDVTFKWYASAEVARYALELPLLREKEELSLKLLPPTARAEEIAASNYSLQAGLSSEQVGGRAYAVRSLTFRIFPPRAGAYAIRPATVTAFVQSGYKIEEDDFLPIRRRVPNYQRVFAASDEIKLTVKDLPVEGKPPEFTGAVGKYDISLETTDTRVKVGDPILLKVILSGTGLLEKIKRPLLSQNEAFARDFSINESLAPGDISGNKVVFEQTIRAKSENVKEIPSLAFSYFNAERGVYETARSKPIPISVLPTTEITAEQVVKFGPAGSAAATVLEEQPEGILANYSHLDALRNQAVRWRLLSFLCLPPAAYLVALAVVTRRRKLAGDLALARSKSARKVLRKHMAEARRHLHGENRQFCDSLARAVSRFTSDKLNLGTGELTAYDVELLARENRMDAELSRRIADILQQCDAGRFAPSALSIEQRTELLHQAEQVARSLERRT